MMAETHRSGVLIGTRRLLRALVGDRRGNAVVELSLIAAPLLAIIIAFFEMGRYFFLQENLANAAREGARAAAVRGAASPDPANQEDIAAIVRRHAPRFVRPDDVRVTLTFEPDNSPGARAVVRVDYHYVFILPGLSHFTNFDISGLAAMTISR
jgi:hypothetical protein